MALVLWANPRNMRRVRARLRKSFLRDVLEHAERRGPGAAGRLPARLPEQLRAEVDLAQLRLSAPGDTLALDEGEQLLLHTDAVLGDGSGRLLEAVMTDLVERALGQGGYGVKGDLVGTLSRVRVLLERPFADAAPSYELVPTPTGFLLTLGMTGQPRSARVLRALAAGMIRAAYRFSGEAKPEALRLFSEIVGDRVRFEARYKALPSSELLPKVESSKPPGRRSRSLRPQVTPLSDEVERIMVRAGLSSGPPVRPSLARRAAVRDPEVVDSSIPPTGTTAGESAALSAASPERDSTVPTTAGSAERPGSRPREPVAETSVRPSSSVPTPGHPTSRTGRA